MKRTEVIRPITKNEVDKGIIINSGYVHVCTTEGRKVFHSKLKVGIAKRLLDDADANGLLCLCDDSTIPEYCVALYDTRKNVWLRLKCDPVKFARTRDAHRSTILSSFQAKA